MFSSPSGAAGSAALARARSASQSASRNAQGGGEDSRAADGCQVPPLSPGDALLTASGLLCRTPAVLRSMEGKAGAEKSSTAQSPADSMACLLLSGRQDCDVPGGGGAPPAMDLDTAASRVLDLEEAAADLRELWGDAIDEQLKASDALHGPSAPWARGGVDQAGPRLPSLRLGILSAMQVLSSLPPAEQTPQRHGGQESDTQQQPHSSPDSTAPEPVQPPGPARGPGASPAHKALHRASMSWTRQPQAGQAGLLPGADTSTGVAGEQASTPVSARSSVVSGTSQAGGDVAGLSSQRRRRMRRASVALELDATQGKLTVSQPLSRKPSVRFAALDEEQGEDGGDGGDGGEAAIPPPTAQPGVPLGGAALARAATSGPVLDAASSPRYATMPARPRRSTMGRARYRRMGSIAVTGLAAEHFEAGGAVGIFTPRSRGATEDYDAISPDVAAAVAARAASLTRGAARGSLFRTQSEGGGLLAPTPSTDEPRRSTSLSHNIHDVAALSASESDSDSASATQRGRGGSGPPPRPPPVQVAPPDGRSGSTPPPRGPRPPPREHASPSATLPARLSERSHSRRSSLSVRSHLALMAAHAPSGAASVSSSASVTSDISGSTLDAVLAAESARVAREHTSSGAPAAAPPAPAEAPVSEAAQEATLMVKNLDTGELRQVGEVLEPVQEALATLRSPERQAEPGSSPSWWGRMKSKVANLTASPRGAGGEGEGGAEPPAPSTSAAAAAASQL